MLAKVSRNLLAGSKNIFDFMTAPGPGGLGSTASAVTTHLPTHSFHGVQAGRRVTQARLGST